MSIRWQKVRLCFYPFARYESRSANYRNGLAKKRSESSLANSELAILSGIGKGLLPELRKQLLTTS